MEIRPQQATDLSLVSALLLDAELPVAGLEGTRGWVACEAGKLLGHVALDESADAIVIRSLVVQATDHRKGIASALFAQAEAAAAERRIFLRTRTIVDWVKRRGYVEVDREACPASILSSVEFSTAICSSVAIFTRG